MQAHLVTRQVSKSQLFVFECISLKSQYRKDTNLIFDECSLLFVAAKAMPSGKVFWSKVTGADNCGCCRCSLFGTLQLHEASPFFPSRFRFTLMISKKWNLVQSNFFVRIRSIRTPSDNASIGHISRIFPSTKSPHNYCKIYDRTSGKIWRFLT